MNQERLNKALQAMEQAKLSQLLISDKATLFYLTGKWFSPGERMLVLYLSAEQPPKLFINELFPLSDDLGLEIIWFNDIQDPVEMLARYINGERTIGIDKNWPARFLLRLMELHGGSSFINSSFIFDQLRMCKDKEEISLMRTASKANDLAMERMIQLVSNGYSEQEMAKQLLPIYEELGAQGYSFDPIIAYGAHAADPHHETGGSLVKEGDCVLFDIGCKKDSYCSDMTRTVFYKYASPLALQVYQTVLEANQRAIKAVRPGARFCDIDTVARDHIVAAGYGKYFTHRTGHSIGLETHDFGDVSSNNTGVLLPGMIFSIEPGIYLPGEVGVRIEDLVLVTEDGCEVLNSYNKEIKVIE